MWNKNNYGKGIKRVIVLAALILMSTVCVYAAQEPVVIEETPDKTESTIIISTINEKETNASVPEVKTSIPEETKQTRYITEKGTIIISSETESEPVIDITTAPEESVEETTEVKETKEIETSEASEQTKEPEKVTQVSSPTKRSLGMFTLTAYCSCEKCCGKWAKYNKTESGTTPKQGRTIAVDKRVIPLGTKVIINGHEYIAEDTGSGVKRNHIDIYFNSHSEALKFGRQKAEVFVYN